MTDQTRRRHKTEAILIQGIRFRFLLSLAAGVLLYLGRDALPFPYPHLMSVSFIHVFATVVILIATFRTKDSHTLLVQSLYLDSVVVVPTFMLSGGFISPFLPYVLLDGVATGLIVRADHRFARTNMLIVVSSYVTVSLLQKFGVLPNYVAYARLLMDNDFFFYLVVSTTTIALAGGYFLFHNHLHWRMGEIADAYQNIALGVGSLSGRDVFVPMVRQLARTVDASAAFVARRDAADGPMEVLAVWSSRGEGPPEGGLRMKLSCGLPARGALETVADRDWRLEDAEDRAAMSPDGGTLSLVGLYDEADNVMGVLGAVTRDAPANEEVAHALFLILGARAGAELARMKADREKLEMEEQLAQSRKMQAIGQLAAGVAHDFNNHMSGISGCAEMLAWKIKADPVKRHADKILAIIEKSRALTDQLLAFARKGKYHIEPIDLHETIGSAVEILRHTIDPKITIRSLLDADRPTIMGDSAQLHSALLNLGLNARDAMPDGGDLTFATRNIEIDPGSTPDGAGERGGGRTTFLEVAVTDTGHGIDPANLPKVFEPFFTTKDVGKGTGLGLAAVYGCVESLGGTVTVESAPGKGATFRLRLPLCETAASPKPTRDAGTEERSGSTAAPGARVMVVDDEEMLLEAAAESLGDMGYRVDCFSSGASALEHYEKHWRDIACVVQDITMPDLHGTELLTRLLRVNPEARVLLASGYSDEDTTQSLLDHGACGLLRKPFSYAALGERIARVIREPDHTPSS